MAFGHICGLENSVKAEYDGDIHAIASKNGDEKAILLSNHRCDDSEVSLSVSGADGLTAEIYYCTDDKHLQLENTITLNKKEPISLSVPINTVVLLKIK